MVRVVYDRQADAAYIYFLPHIEESDVKKTVEIRKDTFFMFDEDEKILGIEILNATENLRSEEIEKLQQ